MSINSFGHLLRFTTWGESHGPAIGAVVDGCPPGLELDEAAIQQWLDRRRPGLSPHTSPRQEPDKVRILSGVFEGRTTGTPISLMIENVDARTGDYPADAPFRPGHADFAYQAKYGLRDPSRRRAGFGARNGGAGRGGGRGSAGHPRSDDREPDRRDGRRSQCRMVGSDARRSAGIGDSLGGVVECVASGVPAGWGAPVYAKLDAELAGACMGINAVKGVEIGEGFGAARAKGSENAEAVRASGIDGGISTGQPIVVRVAFKPTSSIGGKGRHDPCVAIRGAPVVEAMVALVLADHKLLHRGRSAANGI